RERDRDAPSSRLRAGRDQYRGREGRRTESGLRRREDRPMSNIKSIAQFEGAYCFVCGERLTDPEPIKREIGPVCAGKLSTFLAVVGSSAEEIASLVLVDDGAVSRWLRVAMRAVAAGRDDQAKGFFEAARKAARLATAEIVEAQAA